MRISISSLFSSIRFRWLISKSSPHFRTPNPRQVNPFLFYFRSIGNLAVTRSLPIHAISLQWAFHFFH